MKTKTKHKSHESGNIVRGVHGGWVIRDEAHGIRGSFPSREAAREHLRAHKMDQKEQKKVMGSELGELGNLANNTDGC